ncbi:hypothetical protein OB2597_09134 [Pseudooceanicola batsensis HTCC2597]|uniref:Heme oxygenase n=2 Tax=Pseudooceanicola batsensis TaxID=314255 RepID=A3TUU9_PSEBH|nr:hypothetical protein OB2597_09134 [Pseudooceanicola batsensis HTCC2597]
MSQADLLSPAGLGRFLAAQQFGFRSIRTHLDEGDRPLTGQLVDELIERLSSDLRRLDASDPGGATDGPGRRLSGLAVDYIVLGSGLGTAVLKKRWGRAADADVRAAGAYFSHPRPKEGWATLTADLQARSAEGREADRVTADAGRIFEFFEQGWIRSADIRSGAMPMSGENST